MSINPRRPSCCLESAPEPDCTMCIEICIFVHVGWKVDQRRIEWCTMYMSQIGLVEPWSEPYCFLGVILVQRGGMLVQFHKILETW